MGRERRRRTRVGRDRGRRGKLIESLRWHRQWGEHLKAWQKRHDQGHEPPRQFYEQPEIRSDLTVYWAAFNDLSTERQIGMGIGPIPLSKIKSYGRDDLGLVDDDALDRFCAIIRKMDEDYVSSANSSSKTKDQKEATEIPADDAHGVRRMFANLAVRAKTFFSTQQPDS